MKTQVLQSTNQRVYTARVADCDLAKRDQDPQHQVHEEELRRQVHDALHRRRDRGRFLRAHLSRNEEHHF